MILSKYIEVIPLGDDENLVLNFLSGDGVIANDSEVNALLNIHLDEEMFKFWNDRGYFFSTREDEQLEVERLLAVCGKIETTRIPQVVTILPTYDCNCACSYCFEGSVTRHKDTLTESMVDVIFKHLEGNNAGLPVYITLFGGEPLLPQNKELVAHILSLTERIGGFINIVTNGTTLDYYLDLLRNYQSLIRLIQITVDGPREIHDRKRRLRGGGGTFDTILSNIDLVLKELPDTGIVARTNVSMYDRLDTLIRLYEIYRELGLTEKSKFSYYPSPINVSYGGVQTQSCISDSYNFVKKIIDELHVNNPYPGEMKWGLGIWQEKFLHKILGKGQIGIPLAKSCGAANINSTIFGPEGALYACWDEVGVPEKRIGTWYPEWEFSDYGRRWKSRSFADIPECRDCIFGFYCSGGCAKNSERKHGCIESPSCPSIEIERKILHETARLVYPQYHVSPPS